MVGRTSDDIDDDFRALDGLESGMSVEIPVLRGDPRVNPGIEPSGGE